MNVNQLLIKLSKIVADQRSKKLALLVEGKEIDFDLKQVITRQNEIVLEIGKLEKVVTETKVILEELKEETPEEDSKVITASDIKNEVPDTPKKKRGRKKKVETKEEQND